MFFLLVEPIELPDRLIDGRHSWQFGSFNTELYMTANHYESL